MRLGNIPLMIQEDLKTRLERVMDARGFNMKSLSLAAGLGETYVRDVLRRGKEPTVGKLQKLCEALGVSFIYMVEGLPLTADSERVAKIHSSLPDEDQKTLESVADGLIAKLSAKAP